MPLLQKKCKTIFCKTLIANTGINYTKKILEIKFIAKIFVKSILWLEALNIIIIKKKKNNWRNRLKNQIDMKNAIAGKYSFHINHACYLKNLSHKYGH